MGERLSQQREPRIRKWPLRENSLPRIRPGDTIENFTDVLQLNDLGEMIGDFLGNRYIKRAGPSHFTNRVNEKVKISDFMKPRSFFGGMESPRVVFVEPDPAILEKSMINPVFARAFIAIVNLTSTGRGVIGVAQREIIIHVRESQQRHNIAVFKTSRKIAKGDPEKIVKELLEESRGRYEAATIDALRHTVRSGLPSLGKR